MLADAKHDGRAHARRNQLLRLPFVLYRHAVRAADLFKRCDCGLFESAFGGFRTLQVLLDKMRKYFGVGVRDERVSFFYELFFQLLEIFDDSVVYDPDLAFAIGMRVGIYFRGFAVRRPS